MTDVISTIGTGGDYSLLQLWEDAAPANLDSATTRWIGEALAGSAFTNSGNALTLGGSTTSALYYKFLRPAPGAGFNQNLNVAANAFGYNASNGVSISAGDNYSEGVVVTDQYTRIEGFQIKGNGTRAALQCLAVNCTFENCVMIGAQPFFSSNSGLLLSNCLMIKNASGGAVVALQAQFDVVNCGFVVPTDIGTVPNGIVVSYTSGTSNVRNCYVLGATTAANANANVTYSDCLTDQATPTTGFSTITYDTNLVFQTTNTNLDMRPKSGSALIDAGNTQTTSPNDVRGVLRTVAGSCDVGPWEFTAATAFAGSLTGNGVIKSLFGSLVQ